MEYDLAEVIKQRLKVIKQSWSWLADECDVTRDTLTAQTRFFERLSLEKLFFISQKIGLNLMEDYVRFLRAHKKEKELILLGEPVETYTPNDVPVWFCLKATPEIYKANFYTMMEEIRRIGQENGFRVV